MSTDQAPETRSRWLDSYLSPEPPHPVEWERTDMAALDPGERERIIYRVAAEVAEHMKSRGAWRVERSGVCVQVWFGPDRQRCRRADYDVWVEDTTDQHLHRTTASITLRRFADDLDSAGMPEAAELAREAARNPDATL